MNNWGFQESQIDGQSQKLTVNYSTIIESNIFFRKPNLNLYAIKKNFIQFFKLFNFF